MEIVDGADKMDWLIRHHEGPLWPVGVAPSGYEARAVILHAMWEHPLHVDAPTYDEIEKRAIADGRASPCIIGDTNLSEMSTLTGIPGGPSFAPEGWTRLRWTELAARWDISLDVNEPDPLSVFRSGLKSGSWPSSIRPPTEGSLDWESYERLVAILQRFSDPSLILVYSTFLTWYGDTGLEPPLVAATAEELLATYATSPIDGSGQNWWPTDRSWLVYTDYDLCSTSVHGDAALVDAVLDDGFLEAMRLEAH